MPVFTLLGAWTFAWGMDSLNTFVINSIVIKPVMITNLIFSNYSGV
jgi:hypothetical protein